MAINNEGRFQLLVKFTNAKNLLDPLELPIIFKNQLPEGIESIYVVDKRGRRYSACVLDAGDGKVQLSYARWHAFVSENILVDRSINMLCFTLLTPTEFEVSCFDEYGMETLMDYRGNLIYTKHVFEASDETMTKEYIPYEILEDLNEKSLRRPMRTAKLQGTNQHASEVSVIYEQYHDMDGVMKYRAVGFEGKQWTNFCYENSIEEGCSVLLLNSRNGVFRVKVFNEDGVVLGCESGSAHRCRVESHHHSSSKPSFKLKFKSHSLISKTITIPKPFARKHKLHTYEGVAFLFFGNMRYSADLKIKRDRRRPNDLNHVVLKRDWRRFLRESGFRVGNRIRIEFEESESQRARLAVFGVC